MTDTSYSQSDVSHLIAAWLKSEARKMRQASHQALDGGRDNAVEMAGLARMMDELATRAKGGEWAWDHAARSEPVQSADTLLDRAAQAIARAGFRVSDALHTGEPTLWCSQCNRDSGFHWDACPKHDCSRRGQQGGAQ